jgi:hypothetical protein
MSLLSDLSYNESDIITTDRYLNITRKHSEKLCYIKSDFFVRNSQFDWRGQIHPNFNDLRENVVAGHSDYEITDEIVEKHPNFKEWFVVNNFSTQTKVVSLPLGVTNYCDDSSIHLIYGDNTLFFETMCNQKKENTLAYMNFNINTYPTERQQVWNMFIDKSWVTTGLIQNTKEGRLKYMNDIYNSKFCICPRGNGLDTHRLWESLYLKTIPIVIYHTHFKNMTDLPILFINDWSEVTEEFLNIKYEEMSKKEYNLEKLKMSYWENEILSCFSAS